MILVDSHCHLDVQQFDTDREAVVARARAQGIRLVVNPGIDLQHCRQALALADRYPEVYVAVGIHPNSSNQFDSTTLQTLRQMAAHPKVVAIGEIGLDYYWKDVEPAQQKRAFDAQLQLADDLGLPVIIHCREANTDVMEMLRTWVNNPATSPSPLATARLRSPNARPLRGVLHAFPGDLAMAQEAYTWNFVVGLGGPITYKNAKNLHALLPQLRLDRLMLETDAPYLTPHPYRGQRNEPGYIALICEQVAKLMGLSAPEVARQTTAVAARFFQLEALLEDPKE